MQRKYVRMITTMAAKKTRKKKNEAAWVVYILRCANQTLYTGITNNLERRVKMHQAGKAAKYTRSYGPVELVYQEIISTRGKALVREYEIKKLSRVKKEEVVSQYSLKNSK